MKLTRLLVVSGALVALWSAPAGAQWVEGEIGVLAGWGEGNPYGAGIGATGGAVYGDLYAGGRFVYYFGTTRDVATGTEKDGSSLLMAEFAYQVLPTGQAELRLSASAGIARFRQDVTPTGGTTPTTENRKTTSALAPGAVLIVAFPRFKLGLEVQYIFAGDPEFGEAFQANSALIGARLMIPLRG